MDTQLVPPAWQVAETSYDEPEHVTTAAAAKLAGVSVTTIRRWVARGYLEATRTPAGFLVDASGLAAARAQARSRRGRTAQADEVAPTSGAQADTVVSEQPSSVRDLNELVWRPLPDFTAQEPRVSPALPLVSPLPSKPARTARHQRTPDNSKVLEGLQRGLILERAKHQRAVRLKDHAAISSSAYRVTELQERLADVRERIRADLEPSKQMGLTFTPANIKALFPVEAIARAVPSRRTFNIATLLILNGVLMMLMTFIA